MRKGLPNDDDETTYAVTVSVVVGLMGRGPHSRADIRECLLSRLQAGDASDLDRITLVEGGPAYDVDPEEWTARECLLWLDAHVTTPNHYRERSRRIEEEIRAFARYEGISVAEYRDGLTEELRAEVIRVRDRVFLEKVK